MAPTAPANRTTALVVASLTAIVLSTFSAPRATAADDPTRAPATTLSADGRTVTGEGRTLVVSQAIGLANGGQQVTVSGAGYHVDKGIYIGLCLVPPTNRAPTPCVGGQDRTGTGGESLWVSNHPPDYAEGLTSRFGPGGTFTVTLTAQPNLTGSLDCITARCAIATRNDHTRSSDRSQDLFIPVTFATETEPPPPTTAAPGPSTTMAPATTVPTTEPKAPEAEVADDGKSVSDGTRTLRATETEALEPTKQKLTVLGENFDEAAGIFVSLCRVTDDGSAPAPCTSPPTAGGWISNDPPDYGKDVAKPFGPDGSFSMTMVVDAKIDSTTDCRNVKCAITVRSDAVDDRSLDLALPVTFRAKATPTTSTSVAESTSTAAALPTSTVSTEDSNSAWPWIIGGILVVVALAGIGTAVAMRRQTAGEPDNPGQDSPGQDTPDPTTPGQDDPR